MPKKVNVIKVVKEKLDSETKQDFSKKFEKLPRLYLELLENKNKIDPAVSTKEFVPDYKNNSDKEDSEFEFSENEYVNSKKVQKEDKNDFDIGSENGSDGSDGSIAESENSMIEINKYNSTEDDLTNQLKTLLSDDEDDYENESVYSGKSSIKSHRSKRRTPPTLDQLKFSGIYKPPIEEIPAISQEDEEDQKRELLFKFELLKKSYKNTTELPDFNIHSDYAEMKREYDHSVRKLSLETSVENYKTYLIGGFMIIEYIFGNWFNFEMQGFTQQQILSMNSYEKLLIELGEKSYIPEGKQWPVEVRLLFLIIINAAVFIVSKMILKKTGSNLMNMFNSMNTATTQESTKKAAPKRKMRGPNINLNEIPEYESD